MGQHYPLGRIAKPHEIGEVIAFLISSKASFVTGAAWTIDGGLTSLVVNRVLSITNSHNKTVYTG